MFNRPSHLEHSAVNVHICFSLSWITLETAINFCKGFLMFYFILSSFLRLLNLKTYPLPFYCSPTHWKLCQKQKKPIPGSSPGLAEQDQQLPPASRLLFCIPMTWTRHGEYNCFLRRNKTWEENKKKRQVGGRIVKRKTKQWRLQSGEARSKINSTMHGRDKKQQPEMRIKPYWFLLVMRTTWGFSRFPSAHGLWQSWEYTPE